MSPSFLLGLFNPGKLRAFIRALVPHMVLSAQWLLKLTGNCVQVKAIKMGACSQSLIPNINPHPESAFVYSPVTLDNRIFNFVQLIVTITGRFGPIGVYLAISNVELTSVFSFPSFLAFFYKIASWLRDDCYGPNHRVNIPGWKKD